MRAPCFHYRPHQGALNIATLLETAADYLQKEDWGFESDLENSVLRGSVNGDNVTLNWYLHVIEYEEINSLRVYTPVPLNIPEARRVAVAELLTRINSRMANGNFELDFSDGMVRFGVVLDLMDGALTQAMFMRIFMLSLQGCDYYSPTIMSVVYGSLSPDLALEMLDNAAGVMQ